MQQGKMGRTGSVSEISVDDQGALEGRHPHSTRTNVNNAHASAGGGDYIDNFDRRPVNCRLCERGGDGGRLSSRLQRGESRRWVVEMRPPVISSAAGGIRLY